MANYVIPENPQYTMEIRKIQQTDPVNADAIVNPLMETVIGNIHAVKLQTDQLPDQKVCRFVVGTSTAGWTAKDCDYLCDGTDDQVEIKAAIAKLPSTGGEIKLLDGTYHLHFSGPGLDLSKGKIKLSGCGRGNTVLDFDFEEPSANYSYYTIKAGSYCTISDLSILSNRTFTTGSFPGIYIYNVYNVIVENIYIECEDTGILISGPNVNFVGGNHVVKNCYLKNCGLGVVNSSNNIIANNISIKNSDNYDNYSLSQGSSNCLFINNIGIGAGRYSLIVQSGNNHIIIGNYFSDFSEAGVYFNSGTRYIFCNNVIFRPTYDSSILKSIWISAASYSLITHNLIYGKNVTISGGTGNIIENNLYQ